MRTLYYGLTLNHFQSRDPFPGYPKLPGSQNGYSYARNNPINYTDPSGLCEQYLPDEACWSLYEQIVREFPYAPTVSLLTATFGFPGRELSELSEPVLSSILEYLGSLPQWSPYERFDITLNFMHREMITNAQSERVGFIQTMLQLDNCPQAYFPSLSTQPGSYTISAFSTWTTLVWAGGPWDHKPQLDQMLGLGATLPGGDYYFPVRGDEEYEYFYDIWSNIHYGYVGTAAGFDEGTLQSGAAAGDAIAGGNDEADVLNVKIGVELWRQHGLLLTQNQLHQAILSHRDDYLRLLRSFDIQVILPRTNFR